MRFEIPFNRTVYEKQLSLLFHETWKTSLSKNKRNLLFSLVLLMFMALLFYQNNPVGYLFLGISVYYIASIIQVYVSYRRSKKEYFDVTNRISTRLAASSEITIWEFSEDHFYYKDFLVEGKLKWETVKGSRVIDQNLIVDVNYGIPACYIIGIEDVGGENFNEISTFVKEKIKTRNL